MDGVYRLGICEQYHDQTTFKFTTKIPSTFIKEIRKKVIAYSFIPNPHPHPHPQHPIKHQQQKNLTNSLHSLLQLRRNRRSSNHRLIPRALLLRPRQRHIILQRKFRLGIPLSRFKFHHQRIFNGKDRIIFQVFGFGIENLRCDGFVAFVLHNVVDVCGAERVAVHEFEEFTGGAVVGDLGRGWVSVFIIIFITIFYFYFCESFSFSFIPFIFTVSLQSSFALTQTERDENLLDMELVGGSKRHIYPLQWYRTFHGGCDRLAHHLVARRVLQYDFSVSRSRWKKKTKKKRKEKSSAAYHWCLLARHQSRHSE